MGEIQLFCAGCGISFEKNASEIKRQLRSNPNREFYCSMVCYAHSKGQENLGNFLGKGQPQYLTPGKVTDEYSPFRYFMRKAKERKHDDKTNLDLPYLRALWNAQQGKCALSGVQMDLPIHGEAWDQRGHDPLKPSLDRIDSSKGYLKGNVRFVTMIANLAKQNFSDEQLLEFCKAVVQHNSKTKHPYTQLPLLEKIKAKEERRLWLLAS